MRVRQFNRFPDVVELDESGYPADGWLEQLARADDGPHAGRWMVETFPKCVEVIGYGSVELVDDITDRDGPIKSIRFSTGGWSGQESLVSAVEQSIAGALYLHGWMRGGHYEFQVPVKHLKLHLLDNVY